MPVRRTYKAKILVTLRPSVLDPAGTAVRSGLEKLGYGNVGQVRIGKHIELIISSSDEASVRKDLDNICDRMLANPVIENYSFDLVEVESQSGVI